MSGTGVLQALQIFAYVTLANPALLLLDEPDSHLHPSNQALLAKALQVITDRTGTKIILATHSRHLINSAPSDARIFWVDNGTIRDNDDFELVKLLMEIGALDDADSFLALEHRLIVATEDNETKGLEYLLEEATDREYAIVSISGVTNSEIAHQIFGQLISHIPGSPKFIFHRDRDFMTDDEVERWKEQFETDQIKCFVTRGSDIESYFLDEAHLGVMFGVDEDQVTEFLAELRRRYSADIRRMFGKKRREINQKMNRDGGAPHTEELLPRDRAPEMQHIVGKFMMGKVRQHSHEEFGRERDPISVPIHNLAPELTELITQLVQED